MGTTAYPNVVPNIHRYDEQKQIKTEDGANRCEIICAAQLTSKARSISFFHDLWISKQNNFISPFLI